MEINEVTVGLRVTHNKFGEGIVDRVDIKREVALVAFDDSTQGKKEIVVHFLKRPFDVEEIVLHEKYGKGVIFEHQGNNLYYVVFYDGFEGQISGKDLELFVDEESNVADEETVVQIEEFRIIPSNYSEQSSFSSAAKRFLSFLANTYSNGLATIRAFEEKGGNVGLLLVQDKGIIVFKMMSLTKDNTDLLYNKMYFDACKGDLERFRAFYTGKMLMSKNLCCVNSTGTSKCFKYPTRFVFVYENLSVDDVDVNRLLVKDRDIYFRNFESVFEENELFSNFEAYVRDDFNGLDRDAYSSIVDRVVPEYTTLIDIVPKGGGKKATGKHTFSFAPITGSEREFKALALDDDQIKTINDTKPGHYITLANPGTGKSVILVSKAYRIRSINKNSKVLITCFNNPLMQHHTEFAELSGMFGEGFYIKTFHKLIIQLLEENDIFHFSHPTDDDIDAEFKKAIDLFEENLNAGKIKTHFDAIFIDEVQLFEPKWIDMCYKMLIPNKEEAVFELFGDMNQNVRELQLNKKAPWQQLVATPSFRGRYKKIVKNYRNTQRIAKYINALITDFNNYLSKRGVTIDEEEMGMTTVFNDTLGEKVLVSVSSNLNYARIANTIKRRVKNGEANYSDFAIIYPAAKILNLFSPVQLLTESLDKNEIPYDFICGDYITKKKVFDCTGVILTTIDSSLGLDFKHVIFCGLHFWDFFVNPETRVIGDFTTALQQNNPLALDKLSEIGKKVYSACSRAKISLEIMDDLNRGSPIRNIIRPENGKEYFDVR